MIESVTRATELIEQHNQNIKDIIGKCSDTYAQDILEHIWNAESDLQKASSLLNSSYGKPRWET